MNGRELLAWNLKKIRVERGLSQDKLAADSGTDRAYVGKVERQLVSPGVDVLDRFAKTLAVRIADLFEVPGDEEVIPTSLPPGRRKGGR